METVESKTSWLIVGAALTLLTVAFGAPMVAVVALKPIAATLGVPRSIPALAGSAAYLGSALGGIGMGWASERFGVRRVAAFGLTMIATGLIVSAQGSTAALLLGHGVLIGLLGLACLFAPLVTLVSRWFDRRRGTALALVASGPYLAGVVWPSLLEWGIETAGWQRTMEFYALGAVLAALPVCALLRAAPDQAAASGTANPGGLVLGMRPNVALAAISAAIFLCCIPMAMPQGHLVAFCSDLGLSPSRGAAMMSVMLGIAFVSRQFWGWLADRIGGLPTVLAGSTVQAAAMIGFLATQGEAGLLAASATFGIGFSGLVPAYVLSIREHFPNSEAGWRVPVLLLAGQTGMAAGSWLAGGLYDWTGTYTSAFAAGALFNLANLVLLGVLVARRPTARLMPA